MDIHVRTAAPVVSIVMPAYNCSAYIEEAILSVIGQTFTDWELLVIDDCSTDDTFAIAQQLAQTDTRIKANRNGINVGVAVTRNEGITLCAGRYIAFMDSDDTWYPEKLEKQLQLMEAQKAQLCYSSYAIVDTQGQKVKADYLVPEQIDYEGLLRENVVQCSAMLISAQVVKQYRFNPEFYHEDYVLWLQMLKDGHKAVGSRQVLLTWRYAPRSRSFNKFRSAGNRWRIYRQYLHLPIGKSVRLFVSYALAGLRKYGSKA